MSACCGEPEEAEALAISILCPGTKPSDPLPRRRVLQPGPPAGRGPAADRAAEIAPADADVAPSSAGPAGSRRRHGRAGDLARADVAPNGRLALVGLGELEYARGDWKEAIGYLERSKTTQVPVLLKLCRLYFRVGNRAKALETAELVRAFGSGDAVSLAGAGLGSRRRRRLKKRRSLGRDFGPRGGCARAALLMACGAGCAPSSAVRTEAAYRGRRSGTSAARKG